MNWFNNMRVGARLALAFSLVIVLMLVVGWSGISGMSAINDGAEKIYQRELQGLSLIKEGNIQLLKTGRALRGALLEDDRQGRQEAIDNAKKYQVAMTKSLSESAEFFSSEKAKKLIADANAANTKYADLIVKLESTMKTMDLAETNEGTHIVRVEMREYANILDSSMDELALLKEENAKEESEAGRKTFESNRVLMVGLLVLAVVMGVMAGFLVGRSITQPLTQIQGILSEVERTGDYSKKVDYQSSDEVGQAASAFNSMLVALQGSLSNTMP